MAHPPGGSVTGHKCIIVYVFIGLFQLVKILQNTNHKALRHFWTDVKHLKKELVMSKRKNSLQRTRCFISEQKPKRTEQTDVGRCR